MQYEKFWKKWLRDKRYDKINLSKVMYNKIRKYIKGTKILDFGYGTGYFLEKLKKENKFELYGIDPFGKRINGVKIIKVKSLKELKKIDEKFNTIIASEVLEHLTKKEIKYFLNFVDKNLEKGGRVIITVPYREKLEKIILCPYCLKRFHPWLHKQTFDEEKIRNLFSKYKVKIDYITFFDLLNIPTALKFALKFILNLFLKNFTRRGRTWILAIIDKN